jgi:anti-anti-sigma factor
MPVCVGLKIEDTGDLTVVTLPRGSVLPEHQADQLAERLQGLVAQGRHKLVLDLRGVRGVTSTFLGQVVAVHRRLQGVGGRLLLCNVEPSLYDIIATTKLHWVLELQLVEAGRQTPG